VGGECLQLRLLVAFALSSSLANAQSHPTLKDVSAFLSCDTCSDGGQEVDDKLMTAGARVVWAFTPTLSDTHVHSVIQ
jgi:hypothetical protein